MQMESSTYKNANKCIDFVKQMLDAVKEKTEFSKENKVLATRVKSLNEDIERINRVKGLKLTQDQKSINDTLSIV